jgi:hypothetical protein
MESAAPCLARRIGRRRAEQSGLRMGDHPDRRRGEQFGVAALVGKGLGEAGAAKKFGDARRQAAGEHDGAGAMNQRRVADESAEQPAELFQRRAGQRIGARNGLFPQALVVLRRWRVARAGQGGANLRQPGAGNDSLHRNPRELPPHPRQQRVVKGVARREINMAAFGLHHAIGLRVKQHLRDAKAGARAEHADDARPRRRAARPRDMDQKLDRILTAVAADGLPDRVADGAEIIDDQQPVDADLRAKARGPQNPGIIGEFQQLAGDGAGDGETGGARRRPPELFGEGAPGLRQAGEILDPEHLRLVQADNRPAGDAGEGETRMGAANIGDDDLFARLCSFGQWRAP